MTIPSSPFLGVKGLVGPVYRLDSANTPYYDDNDLLVVQDASGFYEISIKNLDQIEKTATIKIKPFPSKKQYILSFLPKDSLKKAKLPSYNGFVIIYKISNSDQVLDASGNIVTAGTFDTYFAKSVVRANGTCESDRARDLVNSLNGTSPFQITFPIDFTVMTVDTITQNNINNALT